MIPHHIEVSDVQEMKEESQLQQMMNKAMKDGLEGLVAKTIGGVYAPNGRHWFKLKKDYMETADTIDLVSSTSHLVFAKHKH